MSHRLIHNLSALAVTIVASIASYQWTDLVSAHDASQIVVALGVAKLILNSLMSETGDGAP